MILTVWLQKGNYLTSPKILSIREYTAKAISKEYFGKPYFGALSNAGGVPHCVVYTEPEKIGTPEGSHQEWLFFPETEQERKNMKKIYSVEPLPSHERKRLSVEGA